ncbi:MAG: hypothetical protein ACTHK0_09415 [Ginsengibacter sp.]
MARKKASFTSEELRARLLELINLSNLEIPGFAELVNISESHLRSLLNGKRNFTEEMANRIGNPFNLNAAKFLDTNFKLTKQKINTLILNKFYEENKVNSAYFLEQKEFRKDSLFIKNNLILKSDFFKSPKFVSDVRERCGELDKYFASKKISQILNYFAYTGILERYHDFQIKKNGEKGKRLLSLFYKK